MVVKAILRGLLGTLVLTAMVTSATAVDTVYRKSDRKTISGDVEQITPDEITINSRSKSVTIPANDVQAVKWSGEPPTLQVARSDERGNRLKKALAGYEESRKEVRSPSPGLQADLEFGVASTTAKLALAGSGDPTAAIGLLQTFREKHATSYHSYDCLTLLGDLFSLQKNWDKAESVFSELASSPIREYQMAAKIGSARISLQKDSSDPTSALAAFDAVIEMKASGPGEQARQYDAIFGKTGVLIRMERYQDALEIVERITEDPAIEDESVLARAYLRRGECLAASAQPKLAALSYMYVDLLLFKDKPSHAEALYRLSQLWGKLSRPARADDARTRLQTLYPDSEWAKQ